MKLIEKTEVAEFLSVFLWRLDLHRTLFIVETDRWR
jgi:hypothetical protein